VNKYVVLSVLPLPDGNASQKYCTLGIGASAPCVGMLVYITSPVQALAKRVKALQLYILCTVYHQLDSGESKESESIVSHPAS